MTIRLISTTLKPRRQLGITKKLRRLVIMLTLVKKITFFKPVAKIEQACTFPVRIWDWLKNNRRNNGKIAMSPKTIEATG